MKKIIILFLMFSAIVFAEWQYGMHHNEYGINWHDFTVYDNDTKSKFQVSVTTDVGNGFSSVRIYNDNIKENNNLFLYIKDNSGNIMDYSIFKKDIKNEIIGIHDANNYSRGITLTKLLVSAQSVELYNNDTEEILATFDTKGLKEILQKRLGNSYWYKYKLND
ncbi:hypothetical protein [Brachyspira catarrhinii]|uniref:Uncharacterized protein n=1 Tax=Brachyspira catarrhinii TaxID=2528966 RepID=A0ABY2TRZ3_9SPIR|nr:hypothetical protein [Brachyspira catarrhinii]TKZ35658.1 hypothetical protein EZH24_04125 [Brachyspira catarrhinii]